MVDVHVTAGGKFITEKLFLFRLVCDVCVYVCVC